MRKIAKKTLCLILMVCMILPTLPVLPIRAEEVQSVALIEDAKGSDFCNNSYMARKLDELFALLPYSDYPYFTDYGNKSCGNSICSHCSLGSVSRYHPNLKKVGIVDPYASYSCFAFARYAFYYIFGVAGDGLNYYGNPKGNNMQVYNRIGASSGVPSSVVGSYGTYATIQDLKNFFLKARTGDIIQAMSKYNAATQKYSNHSMIFLSCDDNGIYVLQNNAFRTSLDKNGEAYGYNRVLISYVTYERFMSTWGLLVTDFRARQDIYDATLAKGVDICTNHTYTESSMDSCDTCTDRFNHTNDVKGAGVYKTVTVANKFSKPYLASDVIGEFAKGSLVEVVATLKNSLGQTWYLLPDGTYCYGSSLTKQSSDASVNIQWNTMPGGILPYGASYDVSGTVSAASKITSVMGLICKTDGTVLQKATVKPNAKALSLVTSSINANLKFANLSLGKYWFMLLVQTEDGKCAFYAGEFTMAKQAKPTPAAPSAPKLLNKTIDSITIATEAGYEYSLGGTVWVSGGVFTGLEPLTEYVFYRRLKETSSAYASLASAPLKVTTLPLPAATPSAPSVSSVTDTTVTLTHRAGLEYSIDGKTWQTSPVFTGLSPVTTYSFVCRVAETATNGVSEASKPVWVTTAKKGVTDIPNAPVVIDRTATSVTLQAVAGYEYRINGGAWQKGAAFTGLKANTEYSFTCRLAETEDTLAGPESTVTKIKTDKHINTTVAKAPVVSTVTATSITLQAVAGYEYRINGGAWQKGTAFTGLKANTEYSLTCRIAETNDTLAGPESVVAKIKTVKYSNTTVAKAPTASVITANSITLRPVSGYEYRVNGGAWQTSTAFAGLKPNTEYSFTCRIAETNDTVAGPESAVTKIKTIKYSNTNTAKAPAVNAVTATSITLQAVAGYEYRINGGAWQKSATFTGLKANTEYSFTCRIAETNDTVAGPESAVTKIKTVKYSNAVTAKAPAANSITPTSITLVGTSGYEYRVNGGAWQKGATFTGLKPNTEYSFTCRIAETSDTVAGPESAVTKIKTVKYSNTTAVKAPTTSSITPTTIVLKATAGYEYRINGGAWQKSATFTGLKPNTEYSFTCRIAETNDTLAGPESPAAKIKTIKYSNTTVAKAPSIAVIDADRIILTGVSGYEYRINGGAWQKSTTFTGLKPNTAYSFTCRIAETNDTVAGPESAVTKATTIKYGNTTMVKVPTAGNITATEITLHAVSGYEYRINGGAWQKGTKFTGLKPNTEYSFTCRIAETNDTVAGPESAVTKIKTIKYTNTAVAKAPTVSKVNANSITLNTVEGYEYSRDGRNWQTDPIFGGLSANTAYSFYCRIAETETYYASAASAKAVLTTTKLTGKTASAPMIASYTKTTVTLKAIAGMEYRVDGGAWQSSPTFENMTAGKHEFTQRYAETHTTYAGAESIKTVQYTLTQMLTSSSLPVNEDKKVIGALQEGVTLADLIKTLDESRGLSVYRKDKKLTDLSVAAATGDILQIEDESGRVYCTYTVIIRGDVSGDGRVNITDMLLTKAHIMNQVKQEGVYATAADVSGDGKLSILDFLQIKASILGENDFETSPIA
ncbi:MAG: hypothetical protein E7616_00055 [Ruminococcaceae bacterium]|nr:hypothetical protein [Oscillospiraceae bacterium]